MANLSDTMRDALGQAAKEALKSATQAASNKSANPIKPKKSPLSGVKGLAAGAGLAAAAPIAYKGVDKLRHGGIPKPSASGLVSKAGDQLGSKLKDTVSEKVDEAGGAGGMVKEAASGLLPGGGGDDGGGGSGGVPGVGKGRRMPVQQSMDVAVPIETAYNQWTQFEDWPNFMHRVTRVTQEDDCTVSFATKIWGKTKEFTTSESSGGCPRASRTPAW
jgi:Polyketide cyclase / dehydrase and lipid transport